MKKSYKGTLQRKLYHPLSWIPHTYYPNSRLAFLYSSERQQLTFTLCSHKHVLKAHKGSYLYRIPTRFQVTVLSLLSTRNNGRKNLQLKSQQQIALHVGICFEHPPFSLGSQRSFCQHNYSLKLNTNGLKNSPTVSSSVQ